MRLEGGSDSATSPLGWQWVWAKSVGRPDEPLRWSPLWRHLDDAGLMAGHLWDQWVPHDVQGRLADACGDVDTARSLYCFLAAVHDVGKASPAFAVKQPTLAQQTRDHGLPLPPDIPRQEQARLRHELAGHVTLVGWLAERGVEDRIAQPLAVVVGSHHGMPPTVSMTDRARCRDELLGGAQWAAVRCFLLDRAAERTSMNSWPADVWRRPLPGWAQVLLCGLVVTADWMSSAEYLFPPVPVGHQPVGRDEERLAYAATRLCLPARWHAHLDDQPLPDRLARRFALPPPVHPHDVQARAVEAAESMDVPGLLIVEAEMGSGKTEAALLAAEVLAARGQAGGLLVALPTQATTNAMFERVLGWLEALPAEEAGGRRSVALVHGKALLNPSYRELPTGDGHHGVGCDDTGDVESVEPIVHSWFAGPRRRLLSEVVVTTFDQLLLGALRAKHVAMRHLAFAGKVIVVDEVHAHDVYMSRFLRRILEWLGAYGAPVVMLSATLATGQRQALVDAYTRGLAASVRPAPLQEPAEPTLLAPRSRLDAAPTTDPSAGAALTPSPYPAITFLRDGRLRTQAAQPAGAGRRIALELMPDDDAALVSALRQALAEGGCALVVRNTVRRAQATARLLRQEFGDVVDLVHSRFTAARRSMLDARLLEMFGKPGPEGVAPARPGLRIVVGTQVVEQSLDIDFDLLVTDLAPIDLLLQRMGRMHRHPRGAGEVLRPHPVREPRCLIVGVDDWAAAPPKPVSGSGRIYGLHPLLRSEALLRVIVTERDGVLRLPTGIAPLVESSYGSHAIGPPDWQDAMAAAAAADRAKQAEREDAAENHTLPAPESTGQALLGWLTPADADPERSPVATGAVRDGVDSIEVLLVSRDTDGNRWPPGEPNRSVPFPAEGIPTGEEADAIAGCAVRLPDWLCQGSRGDKIIRELELTWIPAWQQHPALKLQLVLDLDDSDSRVIEGYRLSYDPWTGLEVTSADT